jgi:hypothetical protein
MAKKKRSVAREKRRTKPAASKDPAISGAAPTARRPREAASRDD